MSCLFCNGKVPLPMRIRYGRYCSALHKEAYFDAMDRLATERLFEARAFLSGDLGSGLTRCLDTNPGTPAPSGWTPGS
jgi:hypothetical protein